MTLGIKYPNSMTASAKASIMPNHIHVIFVIEDKNFDASCRDTARHVSTVRKFGYAQSKSLSSIVASFKSAVTNRCHKNKFDFQWQPNYYEHVIRDFEDLGRIREYIANNPVNWIQDRNNPAFVGRSSIAAKTPFVRIHCHSERSEESHCPKRSLVTLGMTKGVFALNIK